MNEIICEDCLTGMRQLPEKSVDLIVSDPPYGKNIAKWDKINADMVDAWFQQYQRVLKDHGSFYFFGWAEMLSEFWPIFTSHFSKCRWLIWHYRTSSNINHQTWGRNFQVILYGYNKTPIYNLDAVRIPYAETTNTARTKHDDTTSRYGISKNKQQATHKKYSSLGRKPMDVLIGPTVTAGVAQKEGCGHPTQKPEWIIETLVKASSNPGSLVLDPFCGSGTVPVVCKKLGRNFIAYENDPVWAQKAKARFDKTIVL